MILAVAFAIQDIAKKFEKNYMLVSQSLQSSSSFLALFQHCDSHCFRRSILFATISS